MMPLFCLFYPRRDDEAEPLCRRALEISETIYGQNHPKIATCLNNLATQVRRYWEYLTAGGYRPRNNMYDGISAGRLLSEARLVEGVWYGTGTFQQKQQF